MHAFYKSDARQDKRHLHLCTNSIDRVNFNPSIVLQYTLHLVHRARAPPANSFLQAHTAASLVVPLEICCCLQYCSRCSSFRAAFSPSAFLQIFAKDDTCAALSWLLSLQAVSKCCNLCCIVISVSLTLCFCHFLMFVPRRCSFHENAFSNASLPAGAFTVSLGFCPMPCAPAAGPAQCARCVSDTLY